LKENSRVANLRKEALIDLINLTAYTKTMAKKITKRVRKSLRKTPMKEKKKAAKRKAVRNKLAKKPAPKQAKKPEGLKRIKVRLIGIGGGGNSIVSEIAQNVRGASFYAANSDVRSLRRLPRKVSKFQFGKELTHGLGTGMDPEIGEAAAIKEKERIKQILKGQDFVILVACLGGGLGSGAAPVFAKISRDMGNLTYGIFTLPFDFEGEKKMEIARTSLRKVKRRVNAFSVIPNERIFQIIERTAPLNDALSAINKKLSASIQSLIEIIYEPGMINIDFADLRTVFSRRGKLTYLNSVKLGKEKEEEMINRVISSPLYPYSIGGARGILFNISGKKDLSLSQVNQISGIIAEKAHREARIIFGISNIKKGSNIKVTLLATSCRARGFLKKPKKEGVKRTRKRRAKKKKTPKKNPPAGGKKEVKAVRTAPQPAKKKIRRLADRQSAKKPRKRKPVAKRKKKRAAAKKPDKSKIEVRVKTVAQDSSPSESGAVSKEKQRVRKNALQIKKDKEKEEAEIISKEEFWEKPTFLRKKVI